MTRPSRSTVWRLLGEPCEQIGSVNEPRRGCEQGVAWNEKWIYRARDGAVRRVVLWDRYDLVGLFQIDADGALRPELLPDE